MITFRHRAYGTHAQASYCADFLEVLAVCGHRVFWGDFDDFLSDSRVRITQKITPAGTTLGLDDSDEDDDDRDDDVLALRNVELVKTIIEERVSVLGRRYPFEVSNRGLSPSREIESSPYIGILSLCQLHVVSDRSELNPELAFELSVHESLLAAGLKAAHLGTGAGRGSLANAITAAGSELGFAANPNAASRSAYAKDDGADHLAKLEFNDERSGQWVLLGQTTCARSNDWGHKANEAKPKLWSKYMSLTPMPRTFLAVPHHVDAKPLQLFYDREAEAIVLDRLRLCCMRETQIASEQSAFRRLLELGVEWTL